MFLDPPIPAPDPMPNKLENASAPLPLLVVATGALAGKAAITGAEPLLPTAEGVEDRGVLDVV